MACTFHTGNPRWTSEPAGTTVEGIRHQIGAGTGAGSQAGPARAGSVLARHTPPVTYIPAGTAVEVIVLQIHAERAAVGMTGQAPFCSALIGNREFSIFIGNIIGRGTAAAQDNQDHTRHCSKRYCRRFQHLHSPSQMNNGKYCHLCLLIMGQPGQKRMGMMVFVSVQPPPLSIQGFIRINHRCVPVLSRLSGIVLLQERRGSSPLIW